jgi:5-methylcytosine-specific restriction endonuclease McrA
VTPDPVFLSVPEAAKLLDGRKATKRALRLDWWSLSFALTPRQQKEASVLPCSSARCYRRPIRGRKCANHAVTHVGAGVQALAAEWLRADAAKKRKTLSNRRRTAQTKAGGFFTAAEWEAVVFRAGGACVACGSTGKLAADHIVPVSWGGPSWAWNIQPLCTPCNSVKSNRFVASLLPYEGPDAVGGEP